MRTQTLIIILVLFVAGVVLLGLGGVFCVSVRTSTSVGPSYFIEYAAGGPRLSKKLSQALTLDPEQAAEADKVLADLYKEYVKIEADHVRKRKDKQGHLHITVSPFEEYREELEKTLWAELDDILDESQRELARQHLPVDQLFPFGEWNVALEVWKTGRQFHYRGTKQRHAGLSRGSFTGSDANPHSSYARFWGKGEPDAP